MLDKTDRCSRVHLECTNKKDCHTLSSKAFGWPSLNVLEKTGKHTLNVLEKRKQTRKSHSTIRSTIREECGRKDTYNHCSFI